jgi:iron complex transport system substrate-binding protein
MQDFSPATPGSNRHGAAHIAVAASVTLLLAATLLGPVACSKTNTATTTAATTTPVSSNTVYPLTVTDMAGRSVTLVQKPVKIVSVSPTATETLYAVGGTAIGRDSSSKYPAEATSLPTVGSAFSVSVESVAALNPDLVLIEDLSQAQLIPPFEKLGIPVIAVKATSLADVEQGMRLLGQVVNQNQTASQAIAGIEGRIAAAKTSLTTSHNAVILIADASSNVYAAKPESYPGALLELLGQGNLAKGQPDAGPYPGFCAFTGEQALSANPDAIFTISPAPAPAPRLSTMLGRMPGFSGMMMVQNGKVQELDPVLYLQAPGPRIADAVEQLAAYLKAIAA